ncbi:unnamed protein product [Psylliodes chrysocephalus]|uniref:MD-2-related lipid-recognition domain-containing protein n=1 Tax=Psylliodes chrysocephalus TaxID=3402493 RepID=A0A9P0CM39_9CUCU|nr:unnamed protein product [Psylliodes chrysocephala]
MGQCTSPEYANVESPLRNVKLLKFNHTAKSISFDFTLHKPLDDNICVSLKIQRMSNGVSREIPFVPRIPDPCNVLLKHYRSVWVQLMSNIGVKRPDKCPIPAGNYSVKNFVFNSVEDGAFSIPMTGKIIIRTLLSEISTKKNIICVESVTTHSIK